MTARVLVTGAGTGPAENLITSLRAGHRKLFVAGCHADRFELRTSAADAKYLVPPHHHRDYVRALRGLVEREAISVLVPTSDAEVWRLARARRAFGRRVFLPKGSPVELTYTYNENQVLEVIVDAYGRQNRVQIARNTGLSDSEIEMATADLLQIKVV